MTEQAGLGGLLLVSGRRGAADETADAAGPGVEDEIGRRNEDESEEGRDRKTENDRDSERLEKFGAFADPQRQGQHAHDGRGSRHEDRPQAQAPGFLDSLQRFLPVVPLQDLHVLYENDRIVDDDPGQHDDPEEDGSRERRSRRRQTDQDAYERQRKRQHDDQGVHQRLVLHGHDAEDEEHGQEQDRLQDTLTGLDVLLAPPVVELIPARQGQALDPRLHVLEDLSHGPCPEDIPRDLDDPGLVLPPDADGPQRFLHARHVRKAQGATVAGKEGDLRHVGQACDPGLVQPDPDVVFLVAVQKLRRDGPLDCRLNRLGDGLPAEIAFGKVAESTKYQKTHDFFSLVNQNIQQSGMSLESAIFDRKRGALIFFPSPLISTSMHILVQSVKKGLQVAANSLMAISEYVKNINKINQRLKDLLAEIVSDMKSNMTFLAPLLAGIVVGLSAMITLILNKLQTFQESLSSGSDISGLGDIGNITNLFDITQMISPYFIQASIGLYIVEIIFILTTALVTVDAGKDVLKEKYELAKNLKRGSFLYLATALISIIALSLLASIALSGLGS